MFEGEDEDNLNGELGSYFQKMKEAQRHMFMIDVQRHTYHQIPLTIDEYIEQFGELDDECLEIMSRRLLKDWSIFEKNEIEIIIDKWGLDWIGEVMKYNIDIENYEDCVEIKKIIEISEKYIDNNFI